MIIILGKNRKIILLFKVTCEQPPGKPLILFSGGCFIKEQSALLIWFMVKELIELKSIINYKF